MSTNLTLSGPGGSCCFARSEHLGSVAQTLARDEKRELHGTETVRGGSASPNGHPPDGQAATGTSSAGRPIDRNLPYPWKAWLWKALARWPPGFAKPSS